MKTRRCRCKSGINGWYGRLCDQYIDYGEFSRYSEIYGLAARLGFDTAEQAWASNPVVEGSVNPSDFRIHREPYRLGLPSGSSPRGAQMGRRNIIPILPAGGVRAVKLHLTRLQWVDFDYDQWGAYWGCSADFIFCAEGDGCQIFVRAGNREDAKRKVRTTLPEAKFYH